MNELKSQRKCKSSDQIEVFCRIKPPKCSQENECIDVMSSTMLRITAPETNRHNRDGVYLFQEIFTGNCSQKNVFEAVSMPLVRNLLRGQNGLLFSYGVTGSGKTYTMNGDKFNSGIIPRSINAIFNSIAEFQAPKCIFKSDNQNGYFIQDQNAAMIDILQEHRSKNPKKTCSENDIPCLLNDNTRIDNLNEDNLYTVFVSYIEIYNNLITDLLDNSGKQLKLREGFSNVYVEDAKEIEVRSNEEALDVFNAGQKRKRMGVTNANKESSRSHSIFTIKLVQAPVNETGDRIVDDSSQIQISQLSLVDLAGSERNSRAQTAGQSLVEACSINNSLMFLRNCMQALRENQLKGLTKRVQYRNCKLTHLFKNYFDGIGSIKMVICITPEVDDLTETFHVLEFAEMAQEIHTTKQNLNSLKNQKFTPGRRKANQMMKDYIGSVETFESQPTIKFDLDCFQHEFPDFEYQTQTEAKQVLNNIINHLEVRTDRQKVFEAEFKNKIVQFHDAVCTTEKDNILKQFEISNLESINDTLNTKITKSEETNFECAQKIKELTNKLLEKEKKIEQLTEINKNQERQISQLQVERRKNKLKLSEHAAKINNEAESKFEAEKKKLKAQYEQRTQKLNIMRKILEQPTPTSSVLNLNLNDDQDERIRKRVDKTELPAPGSVKKLIAQQQQKVMSMAAQQYRRRRSKSCSDRWIEHKPIQGPVAAHTLLQPVANITKSVTKLGNIKDVVNSKTSKYFLRSEEKEENGDISTKFYKGDVIPTIGGGAQVIFDDIEVLKQESPLTTPSQSNKRPHDNLDNDDHDYDGNDDAVAGLNHRFATPSTPATGSSNSVNVQDRCRSALMGFSKKSKLF